MEFTSYDSVIKCITEECLTNYREKDVIHPMDLAIHLMKCPQMKMHCPQHHYLIPAVLLTASYKLQGRPVEMLQDGLMEAMLRAKNVLAGFCGLYGSCGAAVGLGIFSSILLDATPHSVETWAITNRIVAESLLKISEINGPRCCKRNSFIALLHAEEFLREQLGLDLGVSEPICCEFYSQNQDCKKTECPFFPIH
ncbi:DUF5714 domain-containing protein [Sinanaerobacter sp. ZZT-01]|uniref:DUF5714 domain-containing protein n=1 Tax=Sinanaerobacter sp. ZZT-01 TaxID=3111540 RepID=UPI002D77641C|nr:DUF5714 domain-containing protein [Sinanaerobacter sp. ZZT-01]WRR93653.1 DUF5714 domain-containing protein [Sinanaerobacter sp. ZZT-01]